MARVRWGVSLQPAGHSIRLYLAASFQECRSFSLWPWHSASAADESGVVRKIPGTPWLRGGWKAHDHGMFSSCAREMSRPSLYEVSHHISSTEAKRKNSQPVKRDGRDG
jgi:hypothetical protein